MYALDQVAADSTSFQLAVLNGQAYKPLYVKLKLVWHCNLRCGMCNHWREDRGGPLSLAQLQALVDDLAELGCCKIHITGGEPTLFPDLVPLVSHITARGLKVNMTTNGTLLTKTRARALARAGLHTVNISIDSPVARVHDKVRGVKGSWKKTAKGFRRLRKYLKRGQMRINTVVGKNNYASLATLPEMAADLGADYLNLIPLDEHTGDLQRLNKRMIRDYNERIGPAIAEKGLALGLIEDPRQAFPFGLSKDEIGRSKNGQYALGYYEENRCYAPWTHALITHSGQVSVCCMLRDAPVMGDLRQRSFKEIWQGATYEQLRRQPTLPFFSACRRCDDFLEENRQLEAVVSAGG